MHGYSCPKEFHVKEGHVLEGKEYEHVSSTKHLSSHVPIALFYVCITRLFM